MNVLESFSSIPRVKRLAAHVWRHFSEDRLFDEAASLSYTSLLSMVPLLAVVFGVASAFPEDVRESLVGPASITSLQEVPQRAVCVAAGGDPDVPIWLGTPSSMPQLLPPLPRRSLWFS